MGGPTFSFGRLDARLAQKPVPHQAVAVVHFDLDDLVGGLPVEDGGGGRPGGRLGVVDHVTLYLLPLARDDAVRIRFWKGWICS